MPASQLGHLNNSLRIWRARCRTAARRVVPFTTPHLPPSKFSARTEYLGDTWARRTAGENENKTSGLGQHVQRRPFEFWPVTCHGLSVWDGVEGGSHHDSGAKEPMPARARFETAGFGAVMGDPAEDKSLCMCSSKYAIIFLAGPRALSFVYITASWRSSPPSSHRRKPPRFDGHLHHRQRPVMCITGVTTRDDQAQRKWHKVSPCSRGFCRCHGDLLTRFATGRAAGSVCTAQHRIERQTESLCRLPARYRWYTCGCCFEMAAR